MGARAKEWVARECNWSKVAEQYATFLGTLAPPPRKPSRVTAEYIKGWVPDGRRGEYIETHQDAPGQDAGHRSHAGAPEKSILEMGAYMQITPALKMKLGYGYVRGCYYGKLRPHRSSRGGFANGRALRVRHRSLRRRARPVSLCPTSRSIPSSAAN